ncbi:hypothetical protein ASG42_11640 [Rhizobium sp. Leaf391]|uniref:hypothetical protein n=1 Tax=Rhizobium sp. Leaf391 TaxID=1736360 RepID=UPI000715A834|nr:hypothetical protein [Rhizobium sp. Leaf391]KQS91130.1 hypothetical protein ASG42_11640 [Rhizobium sp. Leaf391]
MLSDNDIIYQNHAGGFDPDLIYEPQGNVRWRDTALTVETVQLYEAMSFLVWRYGQFFNTHVTLSGAVMGFADHRSFAELIPVWNKEMARWLAVSNEQPRKRWRKRAINATPQQHLWMYTLEHGRLQGIHAHQLCIVPKTQLKAFEEHTRHWWSRQIHWDLSPSAIEVKHYGNILPENQFQRQVAWFQYIVKSTRRDFGIADTQGLRHSFEEIFKLEPHWRTGPVYAPRLYGICRALQPTARSTPVCNGYEGERFESMLDQERFSEVYSGWEIKAWERRQRARSIARLQTLAV